MICNRATPEMFKDYALANQLYSIFFTSKPENCFQRLKAKITLNDNTGNIHCLIP